jgi:hypothetical protein
MHVTTGEVALAGSFLVAATALGVVFIQNGASRLGERDTARRGAYARLLAVTAVIVDTASVLRLTVELRSGLKEGLDVAMHHRKPVDPLELHNQLRRDKEPLYQAWSEVWVVGTQEAIAAGNDLVAKAGEIMGAATGSGQARTGLIRYLRGEKWSQEQLDEWNEQIRELGILRREFAVMARRELGSEVARLFTGVPEEPVTTTSHEPTTLAPPGAKTGT